MNTSETVLGYVGARLVRPACLTTPVGRAVVDSDGSIRNEEVSRSLAQIWTLLESRARLPTFEGLQRQRRVLGSVVPAVAI